MLQDDFDLIIFDCDGTLVDSEPITNRVLANYVQEFGLEMNGDEALSLFLGRDMPGIITYLEKRLGEKLPDHFASEFRVRQGKALEKELLPIDGAHDLLEAIEKNICLASNAPRKKIGINLSVTGLGHYFDADRIFSAYDIQKWKPDPDLFLRAAATLECEPARCVVIEDSEAGIEAGIAAGMQVIGFTNGGERLNQSVPYVDHLDDLVSVLAS